MFYNWGYWSCDLYYFILRYILSDTIWKGASKFVSVIMLPLNGVFALGGVLEKFLFSWGYRLDV